MVAQEIEQAFALADMRPEMHVGNKDRADSLAGMPRGSDPVLLVESHVLTMRRACLSFTTRAT
jgi:hypothetical protein